MEAEHYPQIKLDHDSLNAEEVKAASEQLRSQMDKRRSVRHFSTDPVSKEVIENILAIAASAPSGANKQPWRFCAISKAELKSKIREAAEKEERESYSHRMNAEWLADLQPIGTDWNKPFIDDAPWIIVVFRKAWLEKEGGRGQTYYSQESVGIATGFLLTAIHLCGLVALTHTPSPMNFLQDLLGRPENERAYMLIPVGYPSDEAMVPDIARHPLDEVTAFYE